MSSVLHALRAIHVAVGLATVGGALVVAAAITAHIHRLRAGKPRAIARRLAALDVALGLTVVVILALTLAPYRPLGAGISFPNPEPNLMPVVPLWRELTGPHGSGVVVDTLGNGALFAPLGTLLRARFPALTVVGAVAMSAALSVTIEVTQYILPTGRVADINDVIVNTIGALLGAVAVRAALAFVRAAFGSSACRHSASPAR